MHSETSLCSCSTKTRVTAAGHLCDMRSLMLTENRCLPCCFLPRNCDMPLVAFLLGSVRPQISPHAGQRRSTPLPLSRRHEASLLRRCIARSVMPQHWMISQANILSRDVAFEHALLPLGQYLPCQSIPGLQRGFEAPRTGSVGDENSIAEGQALMASTFNSEGLLIIICRFRIRRYRRRIEDLPSPSVGVRTTLRAVSWVRDGTASDQNIELI